MDSPSSSPCPRTLLAWNSIDGSCNVFLHIAHESNDVDHDQTATAFHFFTSIFLFGCCCRCCPPPPVVVVSMGATTSIWVCPTTKHFEVPTMMMMSRRKCLRKKRGQNLRNFRVSYFFSKKKAEKKKKRKKTRRRRDFFFFFFLSSR